MIRNSWLRRGFDPQDDRGAAALLIAAGMVLFMGMAAMTIDLGLAFNERRQDQSAVDAGVMAGALSAVNGIAEMRAEALAYVQTNLDTSYTAGEWQSLWEGCVDPAADRNAGGYDFVALPAPPGWTASDPANWCMSVDSGESLFRLRVPNQIIPTTFGRVLGVSALRTAAVAIARIPSNGQGGILPFGIAAGGGGGGQICLSDAPAGLASDPCDGAENGDFGTLIGRMFGSPFSNPNCTGSPLNTVLAQNIAHGYDHLLEVAPNSDKADEVRDQCATPLGVNTLQTDTGFPGQGLENGLVGPVPPDGTYTYTPRLALSGPTVKVFGKDINNRPLWYFLRPTSSGATYGPLTGSHDGPADCNPAGFNGSTEQDWDGDGLHDPNSSWQHMQKCIDDYVNLGYGGVIFDVTVSDQASRFGYVPRFFETTLGPGKKWRHIQDFHAIYLQTTMWNSGKDTVLHAPGQECVLISDPLLPLVDCDDGKNYALKQLTAFLLPRFALPEEIRGSSIVGANGVNPYDVELFR